MPHKASAGVVGQLPDAAFANPLAPNSPSLDESRPTFHAGPSNSLTRQISGTPSLNHSAPVVPTPREGASGPSSARASPRQQPSKDEASANHLTVTKVGSITTSSSSSSFGGGKDSPSSTGKTSMPVIVPPNAALSRGRGGIVFNEVSPAISSENSPSLAASQQQQPAPPLTPLKIVVSNFASELKDKLKTQYSDLTKEDLLQELVDTKVALELLTQQYESLQAQADNSSGVFNGKRHSNSAAAASLRSESSSMHLQRVNTEMYGSVDEKSIGGPTSKELLPLAQSTESRRNSSRSQLAKSTLEPIITGANHDTFGMIGLPLEAQVASPVAYAALNFRVTKTTFDTRGPAFRRRPEGQRRRVSIATIGSPTTPAAPDALGFPSLPVSPAVLNQRQESTLVPGISMASLKTMSELHNNNDVNAAFAEGTSPRLPVVATIPTFGHFGSYLPSPMAVPTHSQRASRRQSTVMNAPIAFTRIGPNGTEVLGGAYVVNSVAASPTTTLGPNNVSIVMGGGASVASVHQRIASATTAGFNRQDSTMSNRDLVPLVSGYTLMDEIGSGQYGRVFMALRDDAFLNDDDEDMDDDNYDNNSFAARADSSRFDTASTGGRLPSATVVRSIKAIKIVPKRKVKRQFQFQARPASKASSLATNADNSAGILNNNTFSNSNIMAPPAATSLTRGFYKSKHTATAEFAAELSISNDETKLIGSFVGSVEEVHGVGNATVTFQPEPANTNSSSTNNTTMSKENMVVATIGSSGNNHHRNSISTNNSIRGGGGIPSPVKDDPILYEISIMKRLFHRNIVPLEEVLESEDGESYYLVMPYIEKGAMLHLTPEGTCSPLDIDNIRAYMRQILSAVAYLHKNDVAHCDIKPENILVGKNGELYLSDFGVSHIFDPTTSHRAGHQHRDAFGNHRFSVAHTTPSGSPRGTNTNNNTSARSRFVTSNCNSPASSFTTELSVRPTSAEGIACKKNPFHSEGEAVAFAAGATATNTVSILEAADRVSIRSNSLNSNASGAAARQGLSLGIGGVIGSFRMTSTKCTPAYAAPETLSGQAFSGAKADLWSVGVTMYVMMFGHLPYNAATVFELYQKIEMDEVSWEGPALSISQQELVRRMLQACVAGDSEGLHMEDEQEEAMPALESLLALQTALLLQMPSSPPQPPSPTFQASITMFRETGTLSQHPHLGYSTTTASPHMSRAEKVNFEASTDSNTTPYFSTQVLGVNHNNSISTGIRPFVPGPPNSSKVSSLAPHMGFELTSNDGCDLNSPMNRTATTLVPTEPSESSSGLGLPGTPCTIVAAAGGGGVGGVGTSSLPSVSVPPTPYRGAGGAGQNNSNSSNNGLTVNTAPSRNSATPHTGNAGAASGEGAGNDFFTLGSPASTTAPRDPRTDSITTTAYINGPTIARFIRKHDLSIGGEGMSESVMGITNTVSCSSPQIITAFTVSPQLDLVTLSFLGFNAKHGIVKKYSQALGLLRQMLNRNPNERITAAAALTHEFFGRSALGRFIQQRQLTQTK